MICCKVLSKPLKIFLNSLVQMIVNLLLVSGFAALQPAYKASKMEPLDALRHV
jgi:ABC-type lipoprotein release transport system permease subunit